MKVLSLIPIIYVLLFLVVMGAPVLAEDNRSTNKNFKDAQSFFERGQVQQRQGKFNLAEGNYKKSIATVERNVGKYDPILITYLRQLGSLYFQMARFNQSLELFQRAQHLIHRHQGIYSPHQLSVVEAMIRTYIQTNQLSKADKQQRYFYRIVANHYPPNDHRLIHAANKLGSWLMETGQFRDAVNTYEQIGQIGNILHDFDVQINALQALAISEYLNNSCCPEDRLKQALKLVAQNPDKDSEDEIWLLMRLGDLYIATDKHNAARETYLRAHSVSAKLGTRMDPTERVEPELISLIRPRKLVSAIEESLLNQHYRSRLTETYYVPVVESMIANQSLQNHFQVVGSPLPLCANVVRDLAKVNTVEDIEHTVIDLDFTVNAEGKTSNIKLKANNGPKKLSQYVIAMLESARYRPQLIRGKAVLTQHVQLRQEFFDNQPAELNDRAADTLRISAMAACGSWHMSTGRT